MAKSQDDRFNDIAKGQVAAFLQDQLADVVIDRETEIINDLVFRFNSNRLTNEGMLAGIARIAELRKVMADLDNKAKRSLVAKQAEHVNGNDEI